VPAVGGQKMGGELLSQSGSVALLRGPLPWLLACLAQVVQPRGNLHGAVIAGGGHLYVRQQPLAAHAVQARFAHAQDAHEVLVGQQSQIGQTKERVFLFPIEHKSGFD